MNVTDAVHARRSIRQFLPTPVADETIRDLLQHGSRAPSGGNVQPWKIWVVNGAAMTDLQDKLDNAEMEPPGYQIYPPKLWEPHRTARFELGEQMYEKMGIGREDKEARFAHLARNHTFFGAPAGLFCFVDERMGKPQWSDLGMFLQTFMLLAQEAGLATCAQEYWTMRSQLVSNFVNAPEELMLFCGMALGHADPDAPVNSLRSERLPLDQWATFV